MQWSAGLAAGALMVAILACAADRGYLPVYATAEEAAAVRARAPWDVSRPTPARIVERAGLTQHSL